MTMTKLAAAAMMSVSLLAPPILAADPPPDVITQPVADAAATYIPYGASISLADALKALTKAEAEASRHNWHLACAVVDPSGDLLALHRMDDTQLASIDTAIGKARTSARFRRSTKVFADGLKSGNYGALSLPGAVLIEGAFPIIRGGKLVGAIGCSGAAGNQDATAALAGAEELK
jgi:uncharacterized protein GlcG (DUF336 family)